MDDYRHDTKEQKRLTVCESKLSVYEVRPREWGFKDFMVFKDPKEKYLNKEEI
jgi:hypothetical protein